MMKKGTNEKRTEHILNNSNSKEKEDFYVGMGKVANLDTQEVFKNPQMAFEDSGEDDNIVSSNEPIEVIKDNLEEISKEDENVPSSKETNEVVEESIVTVIEEVSGAESEKKGDGGSDLDDNTSSKETNEVVEGSIDATTQEEKKENSSEVKKNVVSQDTKKPNSAKETNNNVSDDAFSLCKIMRRSQIEDTEITTMRVKKETILMLDAILSVSDKKVSKATIVHNLVSAFLEENKKILKEKSAKRKDYF